VALLGPDDTRRRLETATELLELALRAGRRDRVFIAREARIRSLLMLGEIAKVDREIEACTALAEELRLPIHRHSVARFQLARALGDGRFDDATRLNREVLDLGRRSGDVVAELQFRLFDTWLRHLRGEPTPLEGAVEHLLARAGHLGPLPHALATFFYAELGREEAVRHHLERVAKRDFADVPRDEAWLVTVALSAGAASFLGDAPRMRVASRLLEPYADLLVAHQHMRIYMAPVSYVLARLAHGLGDRGAAVVRYEDAIERCRRIGARPFLAVALMGYTELLEAPAASPGERKRARALRAEAEELAAVLGMRRVASARRAGGTIPLG
jgi:hypothetical protein